MKRVRHDKGECYLCGTPATTQDHIPPKCMFPKPRPTDLITVPSCCACNDKTKLDDEYFRLVVAAGSRDSPQSTVLLHQRIIPQMRKAPALIVKFMRSIRSSFEAGKLAGGILRDVHLVFMKWKRSSRTGTCEALRSL
jgi:hypothetical protein